ncbi:glyoxal reductase [Bacillus sp. FJAT-27916]|uniref:aldo/keto reductase n=1 Tax=Bacillus sp. FJAT-27916 TaxID=1679169 RepID=UPI000671117A|nr:aldo/keto reductase [Bacillus sp. FJAT-27916]KMY46549.1 glyoxal reductase [Bacillus sp. FJAT-27916]
MKTIETSVRLNNGVKMPQFGLGVYKAENGTEVTTAVETALKAGYRLIDTASFYQNESGVGEGIKLSGLNREDIFITSKVWNTDQGYESTLNAFKKTLKELDVEYLDLYLIHWPVGDRFLDTWRAFEKLYEEGLIKAAGVSNFQIHHLDKLLEKSSLVPAVNQVELHPRLTQVELRDYCQEKNIQIESWSPLGRGHLLKEPTIEYLAKKHGKTPAQIIIRWHLQNELVVIPKSVTPERIVENADVFDFTLSPEDMKVLNQLNMNERFGQHPDHFKF